MLSPFTGPIRVGLRPDDVVDSPLRGRVVFVVGEDDRRAAAGAVVASADDRDGVVVLADGIPLFDEAVARPVVAAMWAGSDGLTAMVPPRQLFRALRRLLDGILTTAWQRSTGAHLVVWSPDGLHWIHVLAALFPDATVIQLGERTEREFHRRDDWYGNGAAARWEAATAEAGGEGEGQAGGPTILRPGDADAAIDALAGVLAEPVPPAPAPPADEGASPLQDRVVLVVGCPRSGTTWLEHLLLCHPDLGGIDEQEVETWIFHELRDLWSSVERGEADSIGALVDEAQTAALVRRFADELMVAALDRHAPGRTWFVEKTPLHALHLDRIARSHPDAWVVHIIRDGRDVARSLVEVSFGQPDVAAGAREWAKVVRHVAARRHVVPRLRELHYEALVADPAIEVASLMRWMGLTVDDGVREAIAERATRRVSRHGTTGSVGVGKHRSLSPSQLDDIAAEAGDLLVELGYADQGEMRLRRRRAQARRLGASLRSRVRGRPG